MAPKLCAVENMRKKNKRMRICVCMAGLGWEQCHGIMMMMMVFEFVFSVGEVRRRRSV